MSTPQAPIGSGFGAFSTASQVIQGHDLTGKVVVVTGGHAGLGLETTRAFLSAGAKVVVSARSRAQAVEVFGSNPDVVPEELDLMDPVSIDAFATRLLESGDALHLLVANAGIMAAPLVRDSRGYESHFATNHLGHFQLTLRLWPALRKAQGARVVTLSSRAHRRALVDFDDPNFERRAYEPWIGYGQSKTANALFAVGLDARGQPDGVRAFSVHPGSILTGIVRYLPVDQLQVAGSLDQHKQVVIDPGTNRKTPQQGAATTVWCATNQQLDGMGGVYCENCDIAIALPADASEHDHLVGVWPCAFDPQAAERLWALSEKLTGVTFTR